MAFSDFTDIELESYRSYVGGLGRVLKAIRDDLGQIEVPNAAVTYAYNANDVDKSLAHRTNLTVNDTFFVSFFDSNRQSGSSAIWQVVALSGATGSIGDINQESSLGIVLTGTGGVKFKLIPFAQNVVDIRSCGILCDGEAHSHHTTFSEIVTAAKELGWLVTNTAYAKGQESASNLGRAMRIAETVDLRGCNCDLHLQAADQGDVAEGVRFYTGSEPNITTRVINGVTKGIAVRAGGNLNNRQRLIQRIWLQGDGIFNNPDQATCIGVQLESTDSGLTDIHCTTSYCAAGVVILGPQEKHRIKTKHQYDNYAVYIPASSSADTIIVDIDGQNCWSYYWEEDGADTSVWVFLNCESTNDPGDTRPAIKIANGKHTKIGGKLRGHNGSRPCVLVDKATSYGVDHVTFEDLTLIHNDGDANGIAIQVDRCRVVDGFISVHDWSNTTAPCFWFNRIKAAGGLRISGRLILCREGIRIGNTTTDYYPQDIDFFGFSIEMGNTGEGSYPTTQKALVIERMEGGSITMAQCMGQIELTAEALGVDVNLPKATKRYTLTRTAGETCIVRYGGIVSTIIDLDGRTLTANESGNEYDNFGATSSANFTLPTAAAGLVYSFVCTDNSGLTVTAATNDSINIGGSTTPDAGNISTTTIGATVTLKCFDATAGWIATSIVDAADWAVSA